MSGRTTVRDRIRRLTRRAALNLTDEVVERLAAYVELLSRWNERMNLTALDARERGLVRLLLEPLVATEQLPSEPGRLIDIGSGGGSPAIPMRLAAPHLALCMVEAKTRKSAFLREACRQLAIEEASVETARYESLLARPELHEAFDVVTVRAVRMDNALVRGVQAFLKPGGRVLLFRGDGSSSLPEIHPPLTARAAVDLRGTKGRLVRLDKLSLWSE